MHIVASVVPRFWNSKILHCWVDALVSIVLLSITVQYNLISEH